MLADHAVPCGFITILEMQQLAVRPMRQQHRITPLFQGTKHIGAQHQAVIHGNGDIPINPHAFLNRVAFHLALPYPFCCALVSL